MPRLIKFYIVNVAIGFALSAVFVGMVLAFDLAGLRQLILDTPSGWMAGGMLFFSNGIVFAGVQFAIAVMNLAERGEGPRGGLRAPFRAPARKLVLVKVEATAKRHTRR